MQMLRLTWGWSSHIEAKLSPKISDSDRRGGIDINVSMVMLEGLNQSAPMPVVLDSVLGAGW